MDTRDFARDFCIILGLAEKSCHDDGVEPSAKTATTRPDLCQLEYRISETVILTQDFGFIGFLRSRCMDGINLWNGSKEIRQRREADCIPAPGKTPRQERR
jgi:hypothetical protein